MPNYKQHLFAGVVVYLVGLYLVFVCLRAPSFFTGLEWLICTLAGSLFPDIDVKSKGQNYFYLSIFCLISFLLLIHKPYLAAGVSLAAFMPLLVVHRGIFHNIWFIMSLLLVAVCAWCYYMPACQNRFCFDALFFLAGVVSHLYLDLGLRRMLRA